MDARILSDAERERIAREYGVVKVPAKVVVVPRGVSVFDPLNPGDWKASVAKGRRLAARRQQFEALNARLEAGKRAEAAREKRERAKAARTLLMRDTRAEKRKATVAAVRKPRAAAPGPAPKAVQPSDLEWLSLVEKGYSHRAASAALGLSKNTSCIARRLRRNGYEVAATVSKSEAGRKGAEMRFACQAVAKRDDEWCDLIRSGMLVADACAAVGLSAESSKAIRARLKRRGVEPPKPCHKPEHPSWWAEARKLADQGLSINAIGRAVGKAHATVHYALARSS